MEASRPSGPAAMSPGVSIAMFPASVCPYPW